MKELDYENIKGLVYKSNLDDDTKITLISSLGKLEVYEKGPDCHCGSQQPQMMQMIPMQMIESQPGQPQPFRPQGNPFTTI